MQLRLVILLQELITAYFFIIMGDGSNRVAKWYFGGIASCGAACITHPLDTIKVSWIVTFIQIQSLLPNSIYILHLWWVWYSPFFPSNYIIFQVQLQTQQGVKLGGFQLASNVVRSQGFTALYNGLSASLMRQIFYSTTRFAIYEVQLLFFMI